MTATATIKGRVIGQADIDRFFAKVDRTPGCWYYRGATQSRGYGMFSMGRAAQGILAHRFSHTVLVGPIPEGMTIDHLCLVKRCVNPGHLEVVTFAENTIRAHGGKAACKRGHAFTEESTMWHTHRDGHRTRECRTCRRARERGDYA